MDDRIKYQADDLLYLRDWSKKVSGINDIELCHISHINMYIWAHAWCNIKEKIVFINGEMFIINPHNRAYIKAIILHEIGHIFSKKRKGSAREYKSHEWAMQKCVRLGLEDQLYYLKRIAYRFGDIEVRKHYNDKYYNAYKWMKRKSII